LPQNAQALDCLHTVGGVQLFMAPSWLPDQNGVKVQIVDVFALRLATGYETDPAVLLLLTLLIKSRVQIAAGSALGIFVLLLQTLVFLAISGGLVLVAGGAAVYAMQQRRPATA